ncbi:ADP-ribosylglycohydrolase family protein [Hyalangium versicolor]|uniref:ADP-ribosylglycohydrolase family protein n=1 Tax=Hyalangium versicolor TaxID=2861190 RepID=UPI001CCA17C3|nr:ADP-ribosylglycohydrolase family protein [Hyalangium versicolor]
MEARSRQEIIAGALLGTLVGDALGLPREGLSRGEAALRFGHGPLRHQLFFGRGLGSDDTEHACMVGQALLAQPDDASAFARNLGWRLRAWLLSLPAGLGRATLLSILRLWLGFSPERSGIASSGNGAAMRAPLLGVCLAHQPERLEAFVRASSRMTHRDVLAEEGALLVALAAAHGARRGAAGVDGDALLEEFELRVSAPELRDAVRTLREYLSRGESARRMAGKFGRSHGVSGFVLHTVPAALYVWLRHPGDFRRAVEEIIRLGGDADTTGAIVGALVGATVGVKGIPPEWLAGVVEWPRTVEWMERLAERLARQFPAEGAADRPGPLPLFWPGLMPRNLAFLLIVLGHGFRRLLPP